LRSGGIGVTPILISPKPLPATGLPEAIDSTMAESCEPRNAEMIAGGASFAPRR
jgi:hypothetical protein